MLIPEFDVFLSYAPEDKEVVLRLASEMEDSGLRVWWQHHHLKPKESIALLQRQITEKRVIMVLWSKNSAGSGRVQAEARVGAHRSRLIATRIGQVLPPRDTAAVLYADLSDWIRGKEHGAMQKVFAAIWRLIGKGDNINTTPPPIPNLSTRTDTKSDPNGRDAPLPNHEELEKEIWQKAYENNSRSGYKGYLKQYPEGTFAEEAKDKIAQKKSSNRLIIWALIGFLAIYLIAVLIMGILSVE